MRILIIGGTGMLGHQLCRQWRHRHELWVTLRNPPSRYARFGLFEGDRCLSGVDAFDDSALKAAFAKARPEAVINCVGVIKQLQEASDPYISIAINALLPHRLHRHCLNHGARLIHISTDCVFSGERGGYREDDFSDARDLYGRSKYLGEVSGEGAVTLRTSIIGRELETRSGLIEWFLSQQGRHIQGYRQAIYTGLTTLELARVIEERVLSNPAMTGLWQVGSERISKYELLKLAQEAFAWPGEIHPQDDFKCDRSLDSSRFRNETGYRPPSWPKMITELAGDREFYVK